MTTALTLVLITGQLTSTRQTTGDGGQMTWNVLTFLLRKQLTVEWHQLSTTLTTVTWQLWQPSVDNNNIFIKYY